MKVVERTQTLKMFGLVTMLVAIAFIMSPGSFHRIVRSGSDAEDVHSFATSVMDFALVPFASDTVPSHASTPTVLTSESEWSFHFGRIHVLR